MGAYFKLSNIFPTQLTFLDSTTSASSLKIWEERELVFAMSHMRARTRT